MKDLKFEYMKGTGAGGQRKNKVETACRVTHLPTGIQAYADCRHRRQSRKEALKTLQEKLAKAKAAQIADLKKSRRDEAIRNQTRIRTYDYSRGIVTDHRSGKTASLKNVLGKGRIDLLKPDEDDSCLND